MLPIITRSKYIQFEYEKDGSMTITDLSFGIALQLNPEDVKALIDCVYKITRPYGGDTYSKE
jgi:hypothetical protein